MVFVDNQAPATIDLYATPSSTNGRIVLSWIAPGDNDMSGGSVTSYNIKISLQPILTEDDFDNANYINISDDCYGEMLNPHSPGTQESCNIRYYNGSTFPVNNPTVYYFAIKATDEAGNYSISNSSGCVAPYHDITVESIYVINAKDSLDANYWGHTNYLYDTLAVSGDISNNGNLDDTVEVILRHSGSFVESIEETIFQGTQLVTGLEWYATEEYPVGTSLDLSVLTSNQYQDQIRVWSIAEHTGIEWFYENNYPAPTQPANEQFIVAFTMDNYSTTAHFYDYPFELSIDNPFTVINTTYGGGPDYYYCSDYDCKKIFVYLPILSNDLIFYWEIDGLPSGVYEITITAGDYPEDSITINKTVEMLE